jgi:radical SAM superfamily enzyme YgiQ (UPF0313 family)
VSAALKEDGHNVDYLDANFYHKSVKEIKIFLQESRPQLIGLNAAFPNTHVAMSIAHEAKEILPKTKVVLGGPAPSLAPTLFMQDPCVDYVISKEGEKAAVMLARHLDQPIMVPNLHYRLKGEIVSNEQAHPIPIDETPLIDVGNIPHEIKKGTGEIMLITSRGCNSACSFCSTPNIWGKGKKNLRTQSIDRIFAEIEHYRNEGFEFDKVHFLDDNFTTDWDRLDGFMERWNNEYNTRGYRWKCLSRIRGLNERNKLEKMADSGCYSISVGVESASNETLRKIGKGLKIEEVDEFLRNAQGLPIRTKGFFMIGFPWETEDDVFRTIDYAINSGFDDIAVNIVMAYPSTPLYRQAYGKNKETALPEFDDQAKHMRAEDETNRSLAKYSATPAKSLCKNVSIDTLVEMKMMAFQEFYDDK